MKTNQPAKVLRVGVIHNGRILEERLILKKADVTVGRGRDATISLPLYELPVRAPLFVVKRGRYHLAAGNGVRVMLKSGGASIENAGDAARLLPLGDDAQGRAEIGGVTVLFQFVHPPPPMPAVKLPELARVRWSGRIDRPFTTILACIVLAHIGVVLAVQSAPLPIIPDSVLVQDIGGTIIEVPFIPPKEVPAETAGDGKDTKPKEYIPASKPRAQPAKTAATAGAGATRTAEELKSFVANKGVIGILTAKGSNNAFRQLFDDGPRGTGLDELLKSNNYASTGGDVSSKRLVGPAGGHKGALEEADVTTHGPRTETPTGTHINKGDDTKVVEIFGRITPAEPPQVEGCSQGPAIAAFVKGRLPTIQHCYERVLKKNPALAGRLVITFTIDADGNVGEARVSNDNLNNSEVSDCIVNKFKHFKFKLAGCDGVAVSYPFIFVKTN